MCCTRTGNETPLVCSRDKTFFRFVEIANTITLVNAAITTTMSISTPLCKVLRLHVKFGSKKNDNYSSWASKKASDIDLNIVQLSFVDFELAAKFSKRCAELCSLCVVVGGGSLLPSEDLKNRKIQEELAFEAGKAKYKKALKGIKRSKS